MLCSNTSREDMVPIWFIGQYKNPRAFKNINKATLGCFWRWNSTAWNNTFIIKEWLLCFHKRVGNRKIVLLLDNFSAHECVVAELEEEESIPNVHIIWLPSSTTSKYQPMNQGIIRTWKAYYKRALLKHIIHQAETSPTSNSYESVNVFHAV